MYYVPHFLPKVLSFSSIRDDFPRTNKFHPGPSSDCSTLPGTSLDSTQAVKFDGQMIPIVQITKVPRYMYLELERTEPQ